MRVVVLGAVVMALLAGCGAQSRGSRLKPLTSSEARNFAKSFNPTRCNTPGHVLVRYASPVVHGKSEEAWWCVEPARAYSTVGRDLHCPPDTQLKVDFERHRAECQRSARAS